MNEKIKWGLIRKIWDKKKISIKRLVEYIAFYEKNVSYKYHDLLETS